MPVKVVAFEVDDTLWSGRLDKNKFGKGRNAASKLEDNLEQTDGRVVRDRSDHSRYIKLFPDVPGIIHDIVKQDIKLAIVSQNSSQALCDRALFFFQAPDKWNNSKSIISMVIYDEVGQGDRARSFTKIKEWSGASYNEILFFDSDSYSKKVCDNLGVKFGQVSKRNGVDWDTYKRALGDGGGGGQGGDKYDTPFYGQPELGKLLGQGKFASVYDSADDRHAVVKVLKSWTKQQRYRFLEIYNIIKDGHPFNPGQNNDDQYLLMLAMEVRNLDLVGQLKAPKPENFTGWFKMTKIEGIALWKTPLYKKHPFSVPFQRLVKTAFHLAVDEIEVMVKKYGVEHRDAHLANVQFTMQGDTPTKAHLFDWGIAVRMTWDGKRYIRGDDFLVWSDSEAGRKYTPEEFRKYWIKWMVKTEYEANMSRNAITDKDGRAFLQDLDWWYHR